ncbi:hypothetical protein HCB21_03025 [Listeria booriae]|uniref:PIN-like domain-containing protein n=1 Tax=Listeria booriae TaxID=1552123 RepID=UPI0016293082|nr:PIN-like domain-containing protein [Listeria booriae]MBC2158728.1 hypothetical protein [Listeria booriae]
MKNEFKEFYTSKIELSNPDKSTLIVLDTNVLLNIYRISKGTRKEFLDILEGLKDNLFIPYQIGLEYHLDRQSVISEFKTVKDDLFKELDARTKTFLNGMEHDINHVAIRSTDYTNKRKQVVKSIKKKVDSVLKSFKEKELNELFDLFDAETDESDRLSEILNGKVGPSYKHDEIEKIQKEGEKRYANEIPPGYADKKKKEGKLTCYNELIIQKEYGDLISWFQIIDRAKDKAIKAVVFVTDDSTKGDWYYEQKGARAELKKELLVKSNSELIIMGSNSFIKQASSQQQSNLMDFEFAGIGNNSKEIEAFTELNFKNILSEVISNRASDLEKEKAKNKLLATLLENQEHINEMLLSIDYNKDFLDKASYEHLDELKYELLNIQSLLKSRFELIEIGDHKLEELQKLMLSTKNDAFKVKLISITLASKIKYMYPD